MALALAVRILTVLLFGVGCLTFASCVYLLTLAMASFLHKRPMRGSPTLSDVVVLVPAHDEQELIGRCLESLARQSYPRSRRRVVVIADNCTDRTEQVALSKGVEVMVRHQPDAPGKGAALRWALDQLLSRQSPPDVFVMVDADSVAEPDLIRHVEAELVAGAEVVQADYRVLQTSTSPRSRLVATGFLLFHRTRLSGRAALGLPANLVGNGMAFRRDVFRRVPWSAFTAVEDLEYSLALRLAGIRPVFCASAVVFGPVPSSRKAQTRQRMRWEGGRMFMLWSRMGPLLLAGVRRRDWAAIDAAVDLAILPLGMLAMVAGLGGTITALVVGIGAAPMWVGLPWLLSVVALPGYVLLGLRAAGAPSSAYRALLDAPGYLAGKLLVYARLAAGFDPRQWEAAAADTDSPGLLDPDGDGKAWVGGVPIDVVDIGAAVDRVMGLVGSPTGAQVCTVNLDFVVSAQMDPQVTAVLQQSDLNVADGAPVAWLARLGGHRLPRVAGADLVPMIAAAAADRGAPVFFLGGEKRAAAESARRLLALYPALKVAGSYEPPRAAVEDLPNAEMVRLIRESGAAIVLVGLGHPKQERWIAQNRAELGTSVAIGVGGCFDFIATRRRRAPRWMQDVGLEWAFRLAQEPRRLTIRYARDAGWLIVLTARMLRKRRQAFAGAGSSVG